MMGLYFWSASSYFLYFSLLCRISCVFALCVSSQVEVLIAISSVTSPLLFSASGFLSSSVISFIDIFLHDVPTAKVNLTKKCAELERISPELTLTAKQISKGLKTAWETL